MKNFVGGNRTRDLPACSTVPQQIFRSIGSRETLRLVGSKRNYWKVKYKFVVHNTIGWGKLQSYAVSTYIQFTVYRLLGVIRQGVVAISCRRFGIICHYFCWDLCVIPKFLPTFRDNLSVLLVGPIDYPEFLTDVSGQLVVLMETITYPELLTDVSGQPVYPLGGAKSISRIYYRRFGTTSPFGGADSLFRISYRLFETACRSF
jgi:hypothetical protein